MSDLDSLNRNQGGDDAELDPFDAAVDEATASRDEAPADDAAAQDQRDPEDADTAEPNSPGSDAEAGKDDQAAAPAPAQPSDIWANAPQELREAYQREKQALEHRLNSTTGRLSAADRELARLRSERGAAPGATGDQGQQGDKPSQPGNPFESEAVKRFREEYGEIAEPVLGIMQTMQQTIDQLQAPVAAVTQERETQARQSEIDVFTSAHPDWQTYVSDPRYATWLDGQPKAVQEAAARAVNVEDGKEAAWLLGVYKQSIGAASPSPTPSPTPEPSQQPPRRDPRRERQLAAGRDGGASTPPAQSGIPDDFDGAVDAIQAQRERRAQGGRNL